MMMMMMMITLLLIYGPSKNGRLNWLLHTEIVAHPSTNLARRRVTSVIEAGVLPL